MTFTDSDYTKQIISCHNLTIGFDCYCKISDKEKFIEDNINYLWRDDICLIEKILSSKTFDNKKFVKNFLFMKFERSRMNLPIIKHCNYLFSFDDYKEIYYRYHRDYFHLFSAKFMYENYDFDDLLEFFEKDRYQNGLLQELICDKILKEEHIMRFKGSYVCDELLFDYLNSNKNLYSKEIVEEFNNYYRLKTL